MKRLNAGVLALSAITVLGTGCSNNQTPTSPTAATTASGTEVFASFITAGGTASHTFTVAQAGTISLTLTSLTPASTVGLGVGVTGGTGLTCSLSRSVDASPTSDATPQLAEAVDAGTYCVQVFDPGTVTAPGTQFSVTIEHP